MSRGIYINSAPQLPSILASQGYRDRSSGAGADDYRSIVKKIIPQREAVSNIDLSLIFPCRSLS